MQTGHSSDPLLSLLLSSGMILGILLQDQVRSGPFLPPSFYPSKKSKYPFLSAHLFFSLFSMVRVTLLGDRSDPLSSHFHLGIEEKEVVLFLFLPSFPSASKDNRNPLASWVSFFFPFLFFDLSYI